MIFLHRKPACSVAEPRGQQHDRYPTATRHRPDSALTMPSAEYKPVVNNAVILCIMAGGFRRIKTIIKEKDGEEI